MRLQTFCTILWMGKTVRGGSRRGKVNCNSRFKCFTVRNNSCRDVMFSQGSVCPRVGGVPPMSRHPPRPGRQPPGQTDISPPGLPDNPRADPPGQTAPHPPKKTATAVDGKHSTGVHSCETSGLFPYFLHTKLKRNHLCTNRWKYRRWRQRRYRRSHMVRSHRPQAVLEYTYILDKVLIIIKTVSQ